ncbi:RING-type E3 ubiquitin transferase [Salvia divinorum]|uniref:RING-type E3 ubiquitin transferase n=1 Tax=Salvia divinorum TaxID=28513 RepID=A0ABD1G5L8_SALDI
MRMMSERSMRFKVKKHRLRPTKFPHLSLKINLSFQTKVSTHLINEDSGAAIRRLPYLSSDASTSPAAVHLIVRDRLSYGAVRDAVRKSIRDHLRDDRLSQARFGSGVRGHEILCSSATKLVWEKALRDIRRNETLPKHAELNVDLRMRITYSFVHMAGEKHYHGMRIFVDGMREKGCRCSICLEEMEVGDVALRLPCAHMFHGECILRWLRRSLACPLCRRRIRNSERSTPRIDGY